MRALIQRLAPHPASLVELGAAPGDQAVALAQLGYTVSAVDLGEASDDWGHQAQGTMEAAFVEAGINLLIWDLENVPYPIADSSFDVVLLTEVFEHLREYPARTLAEGYRILRPGGLLVLSTPNAAYILNRVKLLCGKSVGFGHVAKALPHQACRSAPHRSGRLQVPKRTCAGVIVRRARTAAACVPRTS